MSQNLIFLKFCSGTWPIYLTDLLSPKLVGVIRARINVRNSYSDWRSTASWIGTQVLTVATAALLTTELSL